jgi:hypothetical protein
VAPLQGCRAPEPLLPPILERILDRVPAPERRKITSINAARLYDFDLD